MVLILNWIRLSKWFGWLSCGAIHLLQEQPQPQEQPQQQPQQHQQQQQKQQHKQQKQKQEQKQEQEQQSQNIIHKNNKNNKINWPWMTPTTTSYRVQLPVVHCFRWKQTSLIDYFVSLEL